MQPTFLGSCGSALKTIVSKNLFSASELESIDRRRRSKAHGSRGRATTSGASLIAAAVADRRTGVSIVPLHSAQRVSPSGKRSGGKRRLQLEHRGHPMLGDFSKPRGRSASLLRVGIRTRLVVFQSPAKQLRAAPDKALAAGGAGVPNAGLCQCRRLKAERIAFGRGPPFPEPLGFWRRKSRRSFSHWSAVPAS